MLIRSRRKGEQEWKTKEVKNHKYDVVYYVQARTVILTPKGRVTLCKRHVASSTTDPKWDWVASVLWATGRWYASPLPTQMVMQQCKRLGLSVLTVP